MMIRRQSFKMLKAARNITAKKQINRMNMAQEDAKSKNVYLLQEKHMVYIQLDIAEYHD